MSSDLNFSMCRSQISCFLGIKTPLDLVFFSSFDGPVGVHFLTQDLLALQESSLDLGFSLVMHALSPSILAQSQDLSGSLKVSEQILS